MFEFLKKLFPRKIKTTATSDGKETVPLSPQQVDNLSTNQKVSYDLLQLTAAGGQSVGKKRELNEDSLMVITSTLAGNAGNTPFGLYIVADGMGGHQYGEVASNTAIRTFGGHIIRKFHPYLFNLPTTPLNESLQTIM
ncbi:MAG: hypothetical protein HQ525_02980, partial [Anaerolineae bacterium]|nr:hypothetical protein [Anaerolineae bacterium]